MGVINITQRSERLGNLGGTSAAHGVTSTDIGTVHHTSARTFAPTYYSRNYQEGNRAIGRGLGAVGDTMLRIGLAIQQREEDRQVDEYTSAMMRTMETESRDERDVTDWNTPQRQHLKGQKRGYYLRTGKGTMNVAQEWDDCFGERFNQIGVSIGANERVRERTMKNLAGYRRSCISRLMDQQASEYRRLELGNATGTLQTQMDLFDSGNDAAIPEIFKQYDRVSQLQRLTPEQAKAGKEELALKLTASVVGRRVTGCQTAEGFDLVEADIKAGMKGKLPDEIAANLGFSGRTVTGLRLADLRTFSLHDPIQQGEDGEFQDIIPDRGAMTPDRILGDEESVHRLLSLLSELDERERLILKLRFGLDGKRPKTLAEVSQEIRRTRERVRQIQNQALAKLRAMLADEAGFSE